MRVVVQELGSVAEAVRRAWRHDVGRVRRRVRRAVVKLDADGDRGFAGGRASVAVEVPAEDDDAALLGPVRRPVRGLVAQVAVRRQLVVAVLEVLHQRQVWSARAGAAVVERAGARAAEARTLDVACVGLHLAT